MEITVIQRLYIDTFSKYFNIEKGLNVELIYSEKYFNAYHKNINIFPLEENEHFENFAFSQIKIVHRHILKCIYQRCNPIAFKRLTKENFQNVIIPSKTLLLPITLISDYYRLRNTYNIESSRYQPIQRPFEPIPSIIEDDDNKLKSIYTLDNEINVKLKYFIESKETPLGTQIGIHWLLYVYDLNASEIVIELEN